MKNKIIAAVLSAVVLAGSAMAMEFDPKFYVGAEATGSKLENIHGTHGGAGLFAGSRLTENVGVELGYAYLGKSQDTTGIINLDHTNLTADLMGYLPISENVDLIGSVGVGRLKTDVKVANSSLADSSKVAPRVGAGAQYKFDNNVGVRAKVNFQKGNDIVKNATTVGIGAFYQF